MDYNSIMNRKFLDTNIFIEIYARSGIKSDKSQELVESREDLYTNSLVISEVEWVLRTAYLLKRKRIFIYLKKILSSNIKVENESILLKTIEFYKDHNVDWTDCLNMFLVKDKKIDKVYSYDKGLDKFNWIKRLEP